MSLTSCFTFCAFILVALSAAFYSLFRLLFSYSQIAHFWLWGGASLPLPVQLLLLLLLLPFVAAGAGAGAGADAGAASAGAGAARFWVRSWSVAGFTFFASSATRTALENSTGVVGWPRCRGTAEGRTGTGERHQRHHCGL